LLLTLEQEIDKVALSSSVSRREWVRDHIVTWVFLIHRGNEREGVKA